MNILASSENNQPFYSIADFFVRFTTLSERNASLQEEKSTFFGVKLSISLQDFDDVPVDLFLPPLVALLFLPLLVTKIDFLFCRLQNDFLFFSQTQLTMQLPAKKTRAAAQLAMQFSAEKNPGCSTGFECVISHWLTRGSVRTVGRSDASDVITKPKFLALMGLPITLSYGAQRTCLRRARSSAIKITRTLCMKLSV